AQLLPVMLSRGCIPNLAAALFRGRYMAAVSAMVHASVPLDVATLDRLDAAWKDVQDILIARVGADYGVFDCRRFREERWAQSLLRTGMPGPRHPNGELDLRADTFRQVSRYNAAIQPLRELRVMLSKLRLNSFIVGSDGRNRVGLQPFKSKTSRNQPSNSEFIFGSSRWMRGLIKPPPGYAVAYIDWEQQEFGIAAFLSGDPN